MPIVWRTILVRPDTKLAMLHRYLQAAMGWRERHLYMFTIAGKKYAIPSRDWAVNYKIYDARRYTLARLFPHLPARLHYVYDFGDSWRHVVDIECEEAAEYRKQYPICVDGAEPCPPEDIGGPDAYREFLVALGDASHPQHRDFSAQTATWDMRDIQRGLI